MKFQHVVQEYGYNLAKILPKLMIKPAILAYVKIKNKSINNLKTPKVITFFITNRCNAKCTHCFYWQNLNFKTPELSLEEIKTIIKSLKNNLDTLLLSGGEPFLREDLPEICRMFYEYNNTSKINIATNGSKPETIYRVVKKILESTSLDLHIQVSLYGVQSVHNSIVGIAIFDSAIETIKKLQSLQSAYKNFHISVLTTISKENVERIGELLKFSKENLKISNHGFQFVRTPSKDVFNIKPDIMQNSDIRDIGLMLTMEEMKKAYDIFVSETANGSLINKFGILMNKHVMDIKEHKKVLKCFSGKLDCVIYPDGTVSMCEFTRPFANLKNFNYNFYEMWTSKEANCARNEIKTCYCTHPCNLMNAMKYDYDTLVELIC